MPPAKGDPEMSFMPAAEPSLCARFYVARSYGPRRAIIQIAAVCSAALLLGTALAATAPQQAHAQSAVHQTPVRIVALGDSLTAGYGLPDQDGFVPRLQAALAAAGAAVTIANAGVSGDTASDGLARLDWSVPQSTDAVIVELGANDMLRGIKPEVTRDALDAILRRLTGRHIAVLLCGMRAAPNLGADYGAAFERVYPDLAAKYGVLLYPFFLDGVAADPSLLQHDGLHPNAAGVAVIVGRIAPKVLQLVTQVRAQHPS
jgi:acyl-CoA thioesterase-1